MLRRKKRPVVLVSGVLGVGLLIGMLIGLLPDWNTPGDGGDPENSQDASAEPPDAQASIVPASSTAPTVLEKLDILIDGRKYLIKSGKTSVYTELKLEELIQKAKATTGDEDGVRVEVVRRENARASAEEALRDGLLKAGLKSLEVDEQGELRP